MNLFRDQTGVQQGQRTVKDQKNLNVLNLKVLFY